MRYIALLSLALLLCTLGAAQTTVGLTAHYRFEGDFKDAVGNSANTGTPVGMPAFGCGVEGQALRLNGANDQVRVLSDNEFTINGELDNREDFTLSFYFKSTGNNGIQYLLAKRDTSCQGDRNDFYIRYTPQLRTLEVRLFEAPNKEARLVRQVPVGSCWQHVAVVRDDNRVNLYLNGKFATSAGTAGRIDLDNAGKLLIGGADCRSTNETTFAGLMDELRVYNRALDEEEVRRLYAAPDQIQTADTLIYLGDAVDIQLTNTCGTNFSWMPQTDVDDPAAAEPTISPTTPGDQVYQVRIQDAVSFCTAIDSIRIRVIDPAALDCNVVYLPKAFTPNGDGLNDTYGISNPYAVRELLSFEIFDRWGGRMFFTSDPFAKWDGTFRGSTVQPGVLLYRVNYVCNGEERVETGGVTVLR